MPGERFLDVGAGWGGLLLWAAEHYGVDCTGITLSHNQYTYVQQRIAQKVFFIFIELAQNIYRYSSERAVIDHKQVGTGVLLIRENRAHFTIFAGNMVSAEQASELQER